MAGEARSAQSLSRRLVLWRLSGERVPRQTQCLALPCSARHHRKMYITWFIICAHVLGLLTSIRAILKTRTSQGAVAWAVSLNTFPYIAVPAYWVFGRSSFEGYQLLRRASNEQLNERAREIARDLSVFRPPPEAEPAEARLLEKLALLPATHGNHAELLIDGQATFDAIFAEIAAAKDYVLVQFYIIQCGLSAPEDASGGRYRGCRHRQLRQSELSAELRNDNALQ